MCRGNLKHQWTRDWFKIPTLQLKSRLWDFRGHALSALNDRVNLDNLYA